MAPMIINDFDVTPIHIEADHALYIAQREKVWHFVKHSRQNSQLVLDQYHFTRYEVASGILMFKRASPKNCGETIDAVCREKTGQILLQGCQLSDEILVRMQVVRPLKFSRLFLNSAGQCNK